VVLLVNLK
jgi:hypothetical protein